MLYRVGDRHLSVHRHPRGRGGDPRRSRQRDRPPRRLELSRRAEPALRTDRLRDRGRDEAAALHRGRPRRVARAAVRRRSAQRPRPLDVHRSTRGAPARPGDRPRDRRASLVRGDDADAGLRPRQPAPVQLAGRPAAGRSGAAARSAPRRHRAAAPVARRGAARARGRPRAGAARGSRPARRRRRPRRPHRRGLRRLRGARHADRREHRARRPGRIVAPDRELPRLPRRHQRHRAHEPRRQPGAQVRRTTRDPLPRDRARARQRTTPRTTRRRARDRRTRRRARHRRRLPAASRSTISPTTRA